MKPAIGLIETESIARGLTVSDIMVKKAPVDILFSKTISPGKYIVLISGDVASVEEAINAGRSAAKSYWVDFLFIPPLHEDVIPAIKGKFKNYTSDALGIVETRSVASAILSLDQALKSAETSVVQLKLGQGLGGKGYFVLTGELSQIEASISSAKQAISEEKLLNSEIIARPHADMTLGTSPLERHL